MANYFAEHAPVLQPPAEPQFLQSRRDPPQVEAQPDARTNTAQKAIIIKRFISIPFDSFRLLWFTYRQLRERLYP